MPQGPVYRLKRLLDRRPFRCAMCSMGGVGSTALARHILSFADKTDREHAYSPAVYERMKNVRLGYLFGNPYNAVLSVFRRGYEQMHVKAMNARSPTPAASLKGVSIEAYLERGVDEFRIERQFDHWIDPVNAKHPTILIKYETFGEHIDEILAFFESTQPFEVRTRRSSWKDQPEPVRRGLERMYGRLLAKIEAMPGVLILPGQAVAEPPALAVASGRAPN